MTFRTTFLETCGSRQISLIGFFRTKTPGESWRSFPQPAFQSRPPKIQEAIVDPQPRGQDWMQITPKAGSLFHAYSQRVHVGPRSICRCEFDYGQALQNTA